MSAETNTSDGSTGSEGADDVAVPSAGPAAGASSLSGAGRALLKVGAWAGRSAQQAYKAVDPAMRQHLAESSLFGLTFIAGKRTPDLRLPDDKGRAVLFVHGLGGHRGNMVPLQRYFGFRGRTRTVSIGFDDSSSIEAMAEQLQEAMRELIAVNDLPAGRAIDLVAHSMGGIICRLALLDEALASRVDRLLTVATPHHGTELARFLDTVKVRSLRPSSELLTRLQSQLPWPQRATDPRLVCFWSRRDLVLLPPETARVDGAIEVERSDCSHNGFLIRPSAIRDIYYAATAEPPAPR